LVLFFNGIPPTARQPHTIQGAVGQLDIQLLSATANGIDVHACDQGHPGGTTLPELLRFQGYIPASLLFIQTSEEQIHLVMEFLVRMFSRLLAIWTLALVYDF